LQLAQGAPQIYNLPLLHRQMLDVLGIRNAQKLIPLEDDQKPRDPISENMNAITGKPLKAFIYQDQDAHLATHNAFLQDPQVAEMIGQNPNAQQITGALQAHIAEHFAFRYRQQIEQQLGAPIPYMSEDDIDEQLPEDYEVQLSRLVAQAAQQLTQQNQTAAAEQQAQQQAEDPIIQMQKQELQIKHEEVQRKSQKDQLDAQSKQQQIELEKQRITGQQQMDLQLSQQKLALEQQQLEFEKMKAAAQMEFNQNKLDAQVAKDQAAADRKELYDGTKLGIDMAKAKKDQEIEILKTAMSAVKQNGEKGKE